jgi:DNA-binding response OmpR family regulator
LAIVKTVLILDEDLSYVFWLGRVLIDAGYQAWPARSGSDAAFLIKELGIQLDLLIVNLSACGAVAFLDNQRRQTSFKIIVIQTEEESAIAEGVDATLFKAGPPDELSRIEWMTVIERVLGGRGAAGSAG